MNELLNGRQVAVLQWIAAGCPDGVMTGESHKVSAAALRSRELVRTSGRGPRWRAEITQKGRAWLANPPTPQTARRGSTARAASRAEPRSAPDSGTQSATS